MTEREPRYCAIIPVYRHAQPLVNVLSSLEKLRFPCFVVDDGNELPLKEALVTELSRWPWVTLLRLETHSGKGAACIEGSLAALAAGFTHAIFADADGQHDVQDFPRILELSKQNPRAMILGNPIFDHSAPLKRRLGRIFSNGWVWIETLSFQIKDSLCGFRCFPLQPFLNVVEDSPLGRGMDYDANIVVRLFWQGVPVVNFDTRIRYLPKGNSNFDLWRDNAALFRLHTRLFFGMLRRSPALIKRRWTPA